MFEMIREYRARLPKSFPLHPISVFSEATVEAAESCAHIRYLLEQVNLPVAEQVTDIGLQYNYFERCTTCSDRTSCETLSNHSDSHREFEQRQRAQTLYIADQYLSPDRDDKAQPSLRVNVLCGDGRMFTAFRQTMIMKKYIIPPIPRFSSNPALGHNVMKHGHFFLFETVGPDTIKLFETYGLTGAQGINDRYKTPTDASLSLPYHTYKEWLRNPEGPCLLSYFLRNRNSLSLKIVEQLGSHNSYVARILCEEWNPYLAGKRKRQFTALASIISSGMFIHACRLHLTNTRAPIGCAARNSTIAECNEHGAAAEAAEEEELANDGF